MSSVEGGEGLGTRLNYSLKVFKVYKARHILPTGPYPYTMG